MVPPKVSRKRMLAKAITWRIVGATDLFFISWLFTGDPVSGLKMGIGDSILKIAFYYFHEWIWASQDAEKYPKLKNSHRFHIYKTLTWRLFSSGLTVLLAWFFIGNPVSGLKISVVESIIQLFLYYFHERIWYRSDFGVKKD